LLQTAAKLTSQLRDQGWQTNASASQIIPLVVGAPDAAVELSDRLRGQGLLVPAIRPPSVSEGGSLVRVSVSYAHTQEMIARLAAALSELAGSFA
jgi:8-amino-7-oxononanoate synthase